MKNNENAYPSGCLAQNSKDTYLMLKGGLKFCCKCSEDQLYLESQAAIDLNTKKKRGIYAPLNIS
jgi:hypothetical protein